jgi:hypothetical protein
LLDPSSISCIQSSLPERWTAYLRAWFCSGLKVAPPPLDHECILNEPIWFNRFLYLQSDSKHGRLPNKQSEDDLIKKAITHISDLLAPSPSADESPWLSREDAILKADSVNLGASLHSLTTLTPHEWTQVVRSTKREPFLINDWVIERRECMFLPWYGYQVIKLYPGKVGCCRYSIDRKSK